MKQYFFFIFSMVDSTVTYVRCNDALCITDLTFNFTLTCRSPALTEQVRQVIFSCASKCRHIGKCLQIVILPRQDTFRKETPNPSNYRIGTDTGRALRHYRHNSP